MSTRVTLTAEPIPGHDGATLFTVDCDHGTTTLLAVQEPGAAAVSPAQFITAAVITLTLSEGCACAEHLYLKYGGAFAHERGVSLPPFHTLRQNVATWLASVGART